MPLDVRSLDVHLFLIKQLLCFCNCILISYSYFLRLKKSAILDLNQVKKKSVRPSVSKIVPTFTSSNYYLKIYSMINLMIFVWYRKY